MLRTQLTRFGCPAICSLVAACSSSEPTVPGHDVGTVTLSATTTFLVPGETTQLSAVVRGSDGAVVPGASIAYTSSNTGTATVSGSGLVTAVMPGQVRITGTSGPASGTIDLAIGQGGLVTPAGGTVSALGGAVELVVPPGAVGSSVAIRIVPTANPVLDPTEAVGSVYLIEPSAAVFSPAATIRVRYAPGNRPVGLPESALGVRLLSAGAWAALPDAVVDPGSAIVSASLSSGGQVSVGWIPPATPCTDGEFRQFDFWLGEWAVSVNGTVVAQSDITADAVGCTVFEWYRPNGGPQGRSINFYVPETGLWYQTYVDAGGQRTLMAGTLQGGSMDLLSPPGGGQVHTLWQWTVEGDRVRQTAATSTNGGTTYGAFSWNGLYTRR